jgi:hypothetical protein
VLAFLHADTNTLVTGDSALGFRRRALALCFGFFAAFAVGWAVKNGSGKKSHGVVTGLFWRDAAILDGTGMQDFTS